MLVTVVGCDPTAPGTTAGTAADEPRGVYALGRIEPAGGIISISAMPGEMLKDLDPDVAENQRVPANGILGILASYDLGRVQLAALQKKYELTQENQLHQIEVAEAQKAQAEAAYAQAIAKQTELNLQQNKLSALGASSQLASEEFAQLEELRATDPEMVTTHQLRRQRAQMETALAEYTIANESYASAQEAAEKSVHAAEANLKLADLTLEQAVQGFELQAIEQEIAVAKETLKRSVLLAPNTASETLDNIMEIESVLDHPEGSETERGAETVLKIFLRPGEFITQMPIIQIADLREMVCIAEVYEADVEQLQVGQQAMVRSPAFGGAFADRVDPETRTRSGGIQARIERIGGVVGNPGLANRNPLAPADRNVVEVRLTIDEPEAVEHLSRRVGLQATVEFAPQSVAESE